VSVNNALHLRDVLSLSGMTAGNNMNYGRLSYEALLNGKGTRLEHRISSSIMRWAKQPLLRNRDLNFFGQLQYDHLQLNKKLQLTSERSSFPELMVSRLGLC
jgi:hemolysin activation/secretion protein